MARMTFESNIGQVIARIRDRMERSQSDSPEIRAALTRVGILIQTQAKINIRQRGLIDTGRLINSIRYEHFIAQGNPGIKVGSFGVPYAAAHEFGVRKSVSIPSHSRITPSGGSTTVRAHDRFMNIREAKYLRRAVRKHRQRIVNILREGMRPQ